MTTCSSTSVESREEIFLLLFFLSVIVDDAVADEEEEDDETEYKFENAAATRSVDVDSFLIMMLRRPHKIIGNTEFVTKRHCSSSIFEIAADEDVRLRKMKMR